MAKKTKLQIKNWRKKNQLRVVSGGGCGFRLGQRALSLGEVLQRSRIPVAYTPWKVSAIRLARAINSLRRDKTENHDLCANIKYFNKHGKLPNNIDMAKIQGKGMYKEGVS